MKLLIVLLVSCMNFGGVAYAKLTIEEIITTNINTKIPNFKIKTIKKTPISNIYEVKSQHGQIIYIEQNGQYLLAEAQLIDLNTNQQQWNLTEKSKKLDRLELLNKLTEEDMIIYSPKNIKTSITVFTDYTCRYCQQFHKEIPKLNKLGIEIRYLAYPRAGINSLSYKNMVSIWCHKDRQQAMDNANQGKIIPATCNNSLAKFYKLGLKLNIRGTPSILLSDGTMISGYLPAEQLANKAIQNIN